MFIHAQSPNPFPDPPPDRHPLRCLNVASVLVYPEALLGRRLWESLLTAEVTALWEIWKGLNSGRSPRQSGTLERSAAPPQTRLPHKPSAQSDSTSSAGSSLLISPASEAMAAGAGAAAAAGAECGVGDPIPAGLPAAAAVTEAAIPRLAQLAQARVTMELVGGGGLGKKLAMMSAAARQTLDAVDGFGKEGEAQHIAEEGEAQHIAAKCIGRLAEAAGSVVLDWKAHLKGLK